MSRINVAVLGCGMMGQEHISYMDSYDNVDIRFLCDPHAKSIETALSLIHKHQEKPQVFSHESDLIDHVHDIHLLVIATPNYMHTPSLLRWGKFEHLCILVEKPVAINKAQLEALLEAKRTHQLSSKIWVAMEYRFIPAIQKLIQLVPEVVGPIKCITIRENRFPFLQKVGAYVARILMMIQNHFEFNSYIYPHSSLFLGEWNKDVTKSGDTLVEKCCHFFDLFRHISGGQEMKRCSSIVQRGLLSDEYGVGISNPAEEDEYDTDDSTPSDFLPIIDSAYVLLDFQAKDDSHPSHRSKKQTVNTMGCLELCMFADGSRHQEEIIVTGTFGRVEAYLPENKVYAFRRSNPSQWTDRSKPPPKASIESFVIDCSDLNVVYPSFASDIPSAHAGYHYASTAIEWKLLLDQVTSYQNGGSFVPQVTLEDGMKAVEMGLSAQKNIANMDAADDFEPKVCAAQLSSDVLDSPVLLQSLWRLGSI